jgi:2-polyprenyl-3-methyl-5-hydroxy-6-metoxy-1,4-benzoquinol methylase
MKAPFDEPLAEPLNAARGGFLTRVISELKRHETLDNGLDAGCGFGYFAGCLSDAGLKVVAFDGRPENVREATQRSPHISFLVRDVEDPALADLGQFDVVSCFGLLYHLENPFRAVRNLAALTRKVLLLESVVVPMRAPITVLYEEDQDVDQGLSYSALIPSETWLIKTLYLAGFPYVYRAAPMPEHQDFRATASKRRRRSALAASRKALLVPSLTLVREPRTRKHLWDVVQVPALESVKVRSALRALSGRRGQN